MNRSMLRPDRRAFLCTLTTGAVFFTTRGAFAEQLALTPEREEGPFYPDRLPLDTDNDLLILNDAITPAVGTVTHLTGKILDAKGDPIRNAVIAAALSGAGSQTVTPRSPARWASNPAASASPVRAATSTPIGWSRMRPSR